MAGRVERRLARRLFTAALNLAEHRHGALFVVLPRGAETHIVSDSDQLAVDGMSRASGAPSKQDLHYLLAGANVLTLPTSVVQSVARIDGAVVVGPTGELVAVGAILKGIGGISGIEARGRRRRSTRRSSARRSKSARTRRLAVQGSRGSLASVRTSVRVNGVRNLRPMRVRARCACFHTVGYPRSDASLQSPGRRSLKSQGFFM